MTPEPIHLLLIEDDDVVREATTLALERYGYKVSGAQDGLAGLAAARELRPDLVLLDVMLPLMDGFSVCRALRAESDVPIIMLTARDDGIDVVQGLEAGADDYVVKPWDPMVLVARIKAALRRAFPPTTGTAGAGSAASGGAGLGPGGAPNGAHGIPPAGDAPDDAISEIGGLRVDHDALEVTVDGEPVALTPTELRLLLELVGEPGVVLSRQTLLDRVWDYGEWGDTRVVDVHVQRLRAKVGAERIETVRGFGYKLRRPKQPRGEQP